METNKSASESSFSPSAPHSTKNFMPLVIGAVLIVILLIVGISMMQGSSQKTPQGTDTQQQTVSPTPAAQASKIGQFPQVSVSNWIVPSTISVQAPQSARLYKFQQNLNQNDFRQITGAFFTVDTADENDKRIVSYSTQTGASMAYMQKPSGSFLFTSDKGVDLPSTGSAVPAQVTQFTQGVLKDPSLKLYGEYSKSADTSTRYYEFHRDWTVVGLPILNLFGLFNASDVTPLASLNLTNSTKEGDPRQNDFNTVTVGVKNGKIASFTSNIRPFASAGASSPVITYDQAVIKLKSNGYTYIYTSPQGSGQVDHEKLYPENKAVMITAAVSDATIAYLEELPNKVQSQMIPYYIFKGTGELQSGYKVNFLAAVPAVTSGVLGTSTENTSLLAQNSQTEIPVGNNQSQQQGTLRFSEQGGIMKGATKYTAGLPTIQCDPPPDPSQLTDVQQDSSGLVFGRAPRGGDGDIEWYVVPEADWDVNKLQEAAQVVWNAATNSAVEAESEKLRRIQKIVADFEQQSAGCPVRVTGSSPSIFVHSDVSRAVAVNPGAAVTYSSPSITDAGWNTVVSGDTITVSGQSNSYLYYEYEPVSFTRPQTGWIVKRSQLAGFANKVSDQLRLTGAEKARVAFELNHAASDVAGDSLFVGLVSQDELNSKVPLNVQSSGSFGVQRIHFYVGRADGQSIIAAQVQPVTRPDFYLLEIGAAAQ